MQKILITIIFLIFGFIILVSPTLSLAADCSDGVTTAVCNPSPKFFTDLTNFQLPNTFRGLLLFVIKAALGLAGLLAVLFVIIGGYQYISSGANQELAETGKKTLTNAIIGVAIIVLSWVIVNAISVLLQG